MRLTEFLDIVEETITTDEEGFKIKEIQALASVRAYREGRHGSEMWKNLSAFSDVTDLFIIRTIPNLRISKNMILLNRNQRFEIKSVEEIKGRGMYIEILAKEVEPSGKSNS